MTRFDHGIPGLQSRRTHPNVPITILKTRVGGLEKRICIKTSEYGGGLLISEDTYAHWSLKPTLEGNEDQRGYVS